tara:strand:+ start:932 stop:1414 length:483 start_codon:yes stop_codon:yes gene_type:complete
MKKSVLDKLNDFKKEIEKGEFNSHFLVGIDVTENGVPHASMMISKGKPFETIGMIDILIRNLKDTRKEVINELSQKNNTKTVDKLSNQIEGALNTLPKHIRDKVIDIKKRLDKAFEEQDEEELAKLKIELQSLRHDELGPDSDDDDDSNFNITDFKGGLA